MKNIFISLCSSLWKCILFFIVMVCASACLLFKSMNSTTIPNVAAEEARIVCANFIGVENFRVIRGLTRTEEGYERYTIIAKCSTGHIIYSDINIQH